MLKLINSIDNKEIQSEKFLSIIVKNDTSELFNS